MTLPAILTAANTVASFFVWLPTWLKVWRTRRAADFSLLSFAIVLYLQFSNLAVALLEGARALACYLAVNAAIVAFTMALIAWVRHKPAIVNRKSEIDPPASPSATLDSHARAA